MNRPRLAHQALGLTQNLFLSLILITFFALTTALQSAASPDFHVKSSGQETRFFSRRLSLIKYACHGDRLRELKRSRFIEEDAGEYNGTHYVRAVGQETSIIYTSEATSDF